MKTHDSESGGSRLSRIRVVAGSTFLESVRDRTLAVPVLLAGLLIGGAFLSRTLSLGQHGKMLQDFGLAGLCLFSNVLVILAVTTSLSRSVEQGTLLPMLAKPLRRGELLLGQYGGVLGVVLVSALAIMGALCLGLVLVGTPVSGGLLLAAGLTMVEVMVVGALAVFFSAVSSPVLATVFAGFAMLIGHTTADVRELGVHIGGRAARAIGEVLYYALPNLEIFDVRAAAVHRYPISLEYVGFAVLYGVLYATVVLFAASWVFERRDLS
ncbi:MAG: ABC transporter permease [Candidatus Eisenbacteria sp.]|nr:ABC transporter permease [Candidatus Eisenbacteria bacterium]